ncbi:MAG: xanthan lyase [Bacteroidales bacterium]|nr:xanthan lyase [Bacteroidales bacterium]
MIKVRKYLTLTLLVLLSMPASLQARSKILVDFDPVCDSLSVLMEQRTGVREKLTLKNIMKRGTALDFYFTASLSEYPLRAEDCSWLRKTIGELLPDGYRNMSVGQIFSNGEQMDEFVVTRAGSSGTPPSVKYHTKNPQRKNIVSLSGGTVYGRGMSGRQIAIWPSHGRYYDREAGKWNWQRAVLFQTVEDLFSTSFVLPYLIPMLENAGAYVMLPRERDVNPVEVIVDNDPVLSERGLGSYNESGKWSSAGTGFADKKDVYSDKENPFVLGTARVVDCVSDASAKNYSKAVWSAEVPRGEYAVYVSYKTVSGSATDAHYTVHHLGGVTSFSVNQSIGGGTWVYLGTFEFDPELCRVELDNVNVGGKGKVTADAVKIGGGMGNMAFRASGDRHSVEETSGLPRYAEAAKYWLQWAGMPYEVYSRSESKDEYRDDIFARPNWVDYMSGGSAINSKAKGLGVPFDAVLAFHTDAGTFPNDSIVGSLAIYTRMNEWKKTYPDGGDRRSARELTDIVQSQIVDDIRAGLEPQWARRGMWNRSYIESRIPPAPSLLTESLSHQNFADMRYALDPEFKFVLCRAIYKGVLKYLSGRYDCPYVVQPLPVRSFAAVPSGPARVRLSWVPRSDSLEPTAVPSWYKVYTRIEDGAFDSGVRVEVFSDADGRVYCDVDVVPGTIYSFRVTALNNGGESFPSETLAVGVPEEGSFEGKYVMVVNNFTRVSAPAWFDSPQYAGFDYRLDSGVPYVRDIAFTGEMYCYDRAREWSTNEDAGFGASWSDWVGRPVAGNTFDFTYGHGRAVLAAGVAFASCSSEAFEAEFGGSSEGSASWPSVGSVAAVDLICGKQVTTVYGGVNGRQKHTVFPIGLQNALWKFSSGGGHILVSGSNIGTDIWDKIYPYEKDKEFTDKSLTFAKNVLGFRWSRNCASRSGEVKAVARGAGGTSGDSAGGLRVSSGAGLSLDEARAVFSRSVGSLRFNTEYSESIYKVDAPDGLAPANGSAATVFRYSDSNSSAGVVYAASDGHKAVSFGFPLETIVSEETLNGIIASTLKFFGL